MSFNPAILVLAKRVKRGVKLLDRKVPNWRTILRKHEGQFDFKEGDHCVLGTLEHFAGRMRVLRKQKGITENYRFVAARQALGLDIAGSKAHGFDAVRANSVDSPTLPEYSEQCAILDALWRAEFEK